ncbi:WXG100 family type VII secretion target [Mycobacterium sp. MAA66]|uniref:WXG100 family type VII secretion target n=1 Tax=Mycobacterium sp. MAA66 TaxID=3156297 RepID=UPI003515BF1B
MAELRVTPEVLAHVSFEFSAAERQLRSGLSALDDEVSRALGSSWTGGASSAYDGVWREWHEGSAKVLQGLSTMSDLLNAAASRYSGTDHSGGAMIDGSGV